MSAKGRKSGAWVARLERWLAARRKTISASGALPPTRELAATYGVNHTSVFRQLRRLEEAGLLWQAASGRFYFREARFLVEKPKPVACLFRRIEAWSFLYQELMEGIAEECERRHLASLLWHENTLVRHLDPGRPPRFSPPGRQRESLDRFVERYGGEIGGVILDHIWGDSAVRSLAGALRRPAVVLCRPGPEGFPAVLPDFQAGAALALAHLEAAGYGRVHVVNPFPGDPSIDYALRCFQAAVESGGGRPRVGPVLSGGTPVERRRIVQRLRRQGVRTALVFPEDNNAALFLREGRAAGLDCPRSVGLVSIQGTRAAGIAGLTHTRTSYAALGRRAVELSLGLDPDGPPPGPVWVGGETTVPGG